MERRRMQRFELLEELGSGGMGTVYLAFDPRLERHVAIKVLSGKQTSSPISLGPDETVDLRGEQPGPVDDLLREARMMARLSHPNVLPVYEVGITDGSVFVVMEHIAGTDLATWLQAPRTTAAILEAFAQAARGLVAAHERGIVHRDFKPSNVLVGDDGRVRVADFGLSQLTAGRSSMVRITHVGGTPRYMAPELWHGAAATTSSDVFAFCVALGDALGGMEAGDPAPPTEEGEPPARNAPAEDRWRARGVSRELCAALAAGLAADPDARIGMAELLALLDDPRARARGVKRAEDSPYRGLSSFATADSDLFFGRDRQVAFVLDRVVQQPFVALTGPSGSGKSSLVLAGVIPRLPADWTAITIRPTREPLHVLEAARAKLPDTGGLIFVDQAEELLTIVESEHERVEFAAALARLASDRVHVLITIRHDFIGRADELPAWRDLIAQNLLLLTAPRRDELAQMITTPAAQLGYSFDDPQLVDDMVAEVADRPGALPLLSFAASRLWEARDRAKCQLTRASYTAMGGVGGALASYAEEAFSALSSRQQAIARGVFRHLMTSQGTKALAKRAELVTLGAGVEGVLEHLISARILVGSDEEIEISHEALLERWPRLVRWRAEDAAGAHHRDELRAAAALWDQRQRDPSYLWRGSALGTYDSWAERWASTMTATELAFASASTRAATRARRTRRALVGASLALLSTAVVVLWSLNREATRNHLRAEAQLTDLLAERGRSELVAGRPLRALVYLNAAFARGLDGPGMRVALGQAARAMDRETGRVSDEQRQPLWLETGGSLLLSGASGEPARLWEVGNGRLAPVATLSYDADHANYDAAISRDGSLVAISSHADNRLRIFDARGKLVATSPDHPPSNPNETVEMRGVEIAHRGDLIATSWLNTVALWDRQANQVALLGSLQYGGLVRPVEIAFSRDDRLLAVTYTNGKLELWQLADKRLIADTSIEGPAEAPLVFVGDHLLVSTRSGAVMMLAIPTLKTIYTIQPHVTAISSLAVAPGGETFATTAGDETARVWRTSDGHQVASLDEPAPVTTVKYSHDGRTIATASASTVGLWDAQSFMTRGRLDIGASLYSFELLHDGIVTSELDGRLKTWTASTDVVATFHPPPIHAATFSPDSQLVATHDGDQKIRFWRAASGEQTDVLDTVWEASSPTRLAFSADGKLLASASHHAAVWELARKLKVNVLASNDTQSIAVDFGRNDRLVVAHEHTYLPSAMTVWSLTSEDIVARHEVEKEDIEDVRFDRTRDAVFATTATHVMMWDVARDRIVWTAEGAGMSNVEVSSDGRFVAANGDGVYIHVWHAATGELYRAIKPPARPTYEVALSPDGTLLAAACGDNRIYVWDLAASQIATAFSGHAGSVSSLAFSPDGARLLSVGEDGRAFVWSVAREQRSPAELAGRIAERLPFRLEGAELVERR